MPRPGGDKESAQDPEPDHDGDLGPALEFKVVLERGHLEEPFALGDLEVAHLDDDRQRDEDEEAADEGEQQFGPGQDGEAGDGAADGQRSGVAHEDLGRRGVPPQEADQRRAEDGGEQGQVQRVPDGVAAAAGLPRRTAGLVALPDAHQRVGAEDHDRGAGGQAVEAVGQVHAVGGGGDDQVGPQHEEDGAERRCRRRPGSATGCRGPGRSWWTPGVTPFVVREVAGPGRRR